MNDLKFFSLPDSLVTLEVTSSLITEFHEKYVNVSEADINSESTYKFLFEINLRKCTSGEFYNLATHTLLTNFFLTISNFQV